MKRLVTDVSRFGRLRDTLFGLCLVPGHFALIFHHGEYLRLDMTDASLRIFLISAGEHFASNWMSGISNPVV